MLIAIATYLYIVSFYFLSLSLLYISLHLIWMLLRTKYRYLLKMLYMSTYIY